MCPAPGDVRVADGLVVLPGDQVRRPLVTLLVEPAQRKVAVDFSDLLGLQHSDLDHGFILNAMGVTERLARVSSRHPWRVVGAWIAAIVLALVSAATLLPGNLTT